jgi:hypothetical protein
MNLRWYGLGLALLLGAGGLMGYLWFRGPEPADPDKPDGPPWFADATGELNLDFIHDAGPLGDFFMPQMVGSGAALFDFTEDGQLKYLYLLQNGGPKGPKNRLYRRGPDGRFRLVAGSGLDIAGYSMGVAVGDVNNDGLPDVLVTQYTGVKLFLNNGDGTFTDATKEAGLEDPLWATSASFFDYNRDGWLDLVVVNYVDYDPAWPCTSPGGARDYCGPKVFKGTVTKLFRNRGRLDRPGRSGRPPLVRFEDVTVSSGLARVPGPGLGVVCADFTGDGWPDIFVANDGEPNRLWVNQHDGTFKEEALVRGLAYDGMGQAQAGMGVAVGDVDGDGLLDLYVTHQTDEKNTLWRQGPRPGLFQDGTAAARLTGMGWRATGFGTLMGDFDQDGGLDIAVVNGRVALRTATPNPDLGPHWSQYSERNQLFANDGSGRFRDVSRDNPAFCGAPNVARGLARGDIDGDGALDLVVTTIGGPARIYRNVAPGRGHWLMVRALDPALRRDAYGAAVTVRAGGRRWLRLINPGDSFLCSSDPRAHFGLGDARHVDAIEVAWPDGSREAFPGGDADRVLVLRRGQGRPCPVTERTGKKREGADR